MIIPALDIINGTIVRLYQGCYHMQTNYGNPKIYLQEYIRQGAKMLHLVDLTGAKNPNQRQNVVINQLIQKITPLVKIQIGGGIRNIQDIETLLKSGVTRIVLSSIAITHPNIVKKWFDYFDPDTLVLALDIRIHHTGVQTIAINGWTKETNVSLKDIITEYQSVGLKHILCTDISKDGTLSGSNISLYNSMCQSWPKILFQSSGGICKLTEISQLKEVGVNSIIIGKAFLEKKFTISEAISCWQNA